MRYSPQMRGFAALVSILAAGMLLDPSQALARDYKARNAFKRATPCPSTGKRSGPCPGFVVDHIRPLCAGGPDSPVNMQWQDIKAAKAKDRLELAECRAIRKAGKQAL